MLIYSLNNPLFAEYCICNREQHKGYIFPKEVVTVMELKSK
jgi:hypothetical protein